MELLGDMRYVESRINLFGDGVSVGVRLYAPNLPLAQKSFWTNPIVHLGDEAQKEAHFGLFGDSANLEA
jgi:hypothetical protein